MSGTNGKVALVDHSTQLTGTCPSGTIDFVGFGINANCFEGSGPTPNLSNTTAAIRDDAGCVDTDDNSADFSVASPTPRNTASPVHVCEGGGDPDPDPDPEPVDGVVISQVYGGGNSAPPTAGLHRALQQDRCGGRPRWLVGAVRASASGTSWSVTRRSPGPSTGATSSSARRWAPGTVDLPTPDVTGTTNMSGSQAKVALVDSTGALAGSCPVDDTVDFAGWGSANCWEGSGPAPGTTTAPPS